ncbi:hypothetical protein B1218_35680, partial [Pseudomonas ogarae]
MEVLGEQAQRVRAFRREDSHQRAVSAVPVIAAADAEEQAGTRGGRGKGRGGYGERRGRAGRGVDRLVRVGPFDCGDRGDTACAAVCVSAEIDDNSGIEINPADLGIDTYRSSGAGGQHVNT